MKQSSKINGLPMLTGGGKRKGTQVRVKLSLLLDKLCEGGKAG